MTNHTPSAMQPTSSASSADEASGLRIDAEINAWEQYKGSQTDWNIDDEELFIDGYRVGNTTMRGEIERLVALNDKFHANEIRLINELYEANEKLAAIVPQVVQAPIDNEPIIRADLERLTNRVSNTSFACGATEYSIDNPNAYNELSAKAAKARDDLQEFVLSILHSVAAPKVATVPSDMVLMPRTLTAKNGAKAELSGEFKEEVKLSCFECDEDNADIDCEICEGKGHYYQIVPVEWTTIKNIYRKAVECCAIPSPTEQASDVRNAATRDTERDALVKQFGDCCMGADPFCAGGCLVEKAIRKSATPADKGNAPAEASESFDQIFSDSNAALQNITINGDK